MELSHLLIQQLLRDEEEGSRKEHCHLHPPQPLSEWANGSPALAGWSFHVPAGNQALRGGPSSSPTALQSTTLCLEDACLQTPKDKRIRETC